MVLTRDQELWAAALWVERNHGDKGLDHIAREVERLAAEGDEAGVATWEAIADCYRQLRAKTRAN
ncbi:MAG: DUF6961 family protein [Pseudomonadota bacterium]